MLVEGWCHAGQGILFSGRLQYSIPGLTAREDVDASPPINALRSRSSARTHEQFMSGSETLSNAKLRISLLVDLSLHTVIAVKIRA